MHVLCVVGTRPNFIKIAALYNEMRNRESIMPILVHTGQHYNKNMSDVFFNELDLPKPDIHLNAKSGTHAYQTSEIMQRFEPVLIDTSPDVVIVVGDVNTSLAASIVAAKCHTPLAHVEAGLRSGDRSMPEEINRIIIDQIADFLFVTERSGIENLIKEGIPQEKIFFVGNVMIDTLMTNLKKANKSDVLQRLRLSKKNYALVTLHRPANSDNQNALENILLALKKISKNITIVLPIHPRTNMRIRDFGLLPLIEEVPRILLTEPMGYIDFLCLMKNAHVVLTDSGGIQEETTILGVPCLTLRNNTERPVTIDSGTNILAGTIHNDIIKAYYSLSTKYKNSPKCPPLWDGKASMRIIDILENWYSRKK